MHDHASPYINQTFYVQTQPSYNFMVDFMMNIYY